MATVRSRKVSIQLQALVCRLAASRRARSVKIIENIIICLYYRRELAIVYPMYQLENALQTYL